MDLPRLLYDLRPTDGPALAANGIVDTAAYRKLGRNQIRIGMFPNVTTGDLERLTASVNWLAARLPRRSP